MYLITLIRLLMPSIRLVPIGLRYGEGLPKRQAVGKVSDVTILTRGAPALPARGSVCSIWHRTGAATSDFRFIAAIILKSVLFLRRGVGARSRAYHPTESITATITTTGFARPARARRRPACAPV